MTLGDSDDKPIDLSEPDETAPGGGKGSGGAKPRAESGGGGTTATATKETDAAKSARAKEQDRTAKGEFRKPYPSGGFSMKEIAASAQTIAKRLAGETDTKALDSVKPNGKDPNAKSDPAPKSAETTAKAQNEQASPDATRVAKHLADAYQALELEGWPKDVLAGLAPEKILAMGSHAKELHRERARKLQENAAAQTAVADRGSEKPATTATDASKEGDSETPADLEALAGKHFAQYRDDAGFTKSLAAFTKDSTSQIAKALRAEFAEGLGKFRGEIEGAVQYERTLDRVRNAFPQVDTTDGRTALEPLVLGAIQSGQFKTLEAAVRGQCLALGWTDQEAAAKAAAAEADRAARQNGSGVDTGTREAVKARTFRDDAVEEARKHGLIS